MADQTHCEPDRPHSTRVAHGASYYVPYQLLPGYAKDNSSVCTLTGCSLWLHTQGVEMELYGVNTEVSWPTTARLTDCTRLVWLAHGTTAEPAAPRHTGGGAAPIHTGGGAAPRHTGRGAEYVARTLTSRADHSANTRRGRVQLHGTSRTIQCGKKHT